MGMRFMCDHHFRNVFMSECDKGLVSCDFQIEFDFIIPFVFLGLKDIAIAVAIGCLLWCHRSRENL